MPCDPCTPKRAPTPRHHPEHVKGVTGPKAYLTIHITAPITACQPRRCNSANPFSSLCRGVGGLNVVCKVGRGPGNSHDMLPVMPRSQGYNHRCTMAVAGTSCQQPSRHVPNRGANSGRGRSCRAIRAPLRVPQRLGIIRNM